MESRQGIIVGAEMLRQRFLLNRLSEHPTQCRPIDSSMMNAKSDDAVRELIHQNQQTSQQGCDPRRGDLVTAAAMDPGSGAYA